MIRFFKEIIHKKVAIYVLEILKQPDQPFKISKEKRGKPNPFPHDQIKSVKSLDYIWLIAPFLLLPAVKEYISTLETLKFGLGFRRHYASFENPVKHLRWSILQK